MSEILTHHDSTTSPLLILGCVVSIAGVMFVGWAKKVIARPAPKAKR